MPTGPHDRNDDFMTHEPPELQRLQGQERDREITLSMGTILGIFFALALVCAVFFGMGYTLGRHSAQPQATADGAPADSNFSGFKPSPQSVAIQPAPGYSPAQAAAANSGTDSSSTVTPPGSSVTSAPSVTTATTTATTSATMPASTKPAAVTVPVPLAAPVQQNLIVQVAAVSHQEDADILLSALRKQGYTVTARQVPEDKLIHIQIGPFNNRKDADAMRQKLLSDGYSAIVK